MASIQDVQAPHPQARRYGAHQIDICMKGMLHNILPVVTTDPNKLEAQAKRCMTEKGYNYVAGGAGERQTMDANRLAFRSWRVCHLFSGSIDYLVLHFHIFQPYPMVDPIDRGLI